MFRTGTNFEDYNTWSYLLPRRLSFRTGTNLEDYNTRSQSTIHLVKFRTDSNLKDCNTMKDLIVFWTSFALVHISRTATLIAHQHYTDIV
jgi:hypothetical protein